MEPYIAEKSKEFERELLLRFSPKVSGSTNDLLNIFESALQETYYKGRDEGINEGIDIANDEI